MNINMELDLDIFSNRQESKNLNKEIYNGAIGKEIQLKPLINHDTCRISSYIKQAIRFGVSI